MQFYNVGVDELSEYDLSRVPESGYEWLVYWYENGGYDGSGEAVALREDGKLEARNLGHCSCYGPMDEWGGDVMTVEEFFRTKTSIYEDSYDRLHAKVKDLLGME